MPAAEGMESPALVRLRTSEGLPPAESGMAEVLLRSTIAFEGLGPAPESLARPRILALAIAQARRLSAKLPVRL